MNVLKATFQFALRTRWKLALVVFLLGAALATMARSMEINPFLIDLQEFMEANMPADSASPDQFQSFGKMMGLLALSTFLRTLFFFGATLFGLLVVGRLVAGERTSGAVMLWAQHPGSLPVFYAKRYAALQVANLAVQLAFGITVATAALGPGGSAGVALSAFVQPVTLGLLAAAVSFGLSSLGVRRNAFAGVAYIVLSHLMGPLFLELEAPLSSGSWEPVAAVVPYVLFPGQAVGDFAAGFRSGWDWEATGLVLYHFALWSALAWFGLRRVARRPLDLP